MKFLYADVMNFEQNGDDLSLTARFTKQAQDFDDLQNEMAGREVGRISRFLTGDEHGPMAAEKRRAKWNATLTNLQIMMNDLEYAQLYRDTETKLRETQSTLDSALERVQHMKIGAEAALSETLEHAARLPDGRRVFKDQVDQVLFENGDQVDADLAATVVWNGSEPGYEEMRAQSDAVNDLIVLEADIYTGQAEIGDMQERMADENDPVTEEQMPEFQERSNEIGADVTSKLQAYTNSTPVNTAAPFSAPEIIEIPTL
ncbi:MAG: hypothetical protein GQ535_15535 [Rhodobacteraceae bacterium]|nr:hypothetical protein [Paracoccaceae bacterium]